MIPIFIYVYFYFLFTFIFHETFPSLPIEIGNKLFNKSSRNAYLSIRDTPRKRTETGILSSLPSYLFIIRPEM